VQLKSVLAGALLCLLLAGCAPVPEDAAEGEGEEVVAPIVDPVNPAETADFSYLEGTWSVTAALTEIDAGTMREAADQPLQRWEFQIDGSAMTLVTDTRTYVGTIEPELDEGWACYGQATYEDEDGAGWTSAIEIHGKRIAEGTFSGRMQATVDSASGNHQYTASWDVEGHR
jgi:hypothetical protein